MKKTTAFSVVAFVAITIVSCSKTSSGYLPATSVNQVSARQEPVKVRLISDWQSLAFTSAAVNSLPALQGQTALTQIVSYETGMHKQLAYVKIPGRDGASYRSLPATYFTPDGNHSLSFSLDYSTFRVAISNTDFPMQQINTQGFSNFQFRYIVIPIEVYQSLQIDWSDLPAVATALNFSL